MKSNKDEARRLEISSKLIKMGNSLVDEGLESEDILISGAGTNLMLIAGLILDKKAMGEFALLTAMFTSKQLMDDMMKSPLGIMNMMSGLEDNLGKIEGLDGIEGFDAINDLLSKNNKDKPDDDDEPKKE
jgi:hypothetical protein